MTRNDSPRPDDAHLPAHLYYHQSDFHPDDQDTSDPRDSPDFAYGQDGYPETINQDQNDLLEDYDPYYHQNYDSNQIPLDPMFHHSVTSEDKRHDDFDSNWQQHYRDPSVDRTTPDSDPFYNDFEGYDDHDERHNSHENDYYYYDQSYADYDDGEERAETYYDEDILENQFKKLDLDRSHSAYEDTFFDSDLNQHFHFNCKICDGFIEEFYNHRDHLDEFHDYNDETTDYYNWVPKDTVHNKLNLMYL